MPDLIPGSVIEAADWPPSVSDSDSTTVLNVANTSYIPGTPEVAVPFIAPSSGRVLLIVSLAAGDNTGTWRLAHAPEIYEGGDATGTRVVDADVGLRGVLTPQTATNFGCWSRITLLENLTPRAQYYARGVYRVTGGSSCDMTYRDIAVMAVP